MPPLSFESIELAVLFGVVPPLIWLYFLLREDARCPEPRALIFIAFLAGMLAVPLVIPFESYFLNYFEGNNLICQMTGGSCVPVILAWAVIEETMKYGAAAILILWRRDVDESLDFVIYMLTVALGFAALENTLFLVTPFAQGNILSSGGAFALDNLRFMGSTLLHVISSSAIGFALAFSYHQPRWVRIIASAGGLILAVALHTTFNFFIINQTGTAVIDAFFVVWTGVVIFFALFEVLKYLRYKNLPTNTC
jgi:RsiW-degrading membrane proteinase PrsW (M82 family)